MLNNLHFWFKLITIENMGEIKENQKVKISFKVEGNVEQELNCLIKEVYSDRIFLNFPDEALDYAEYLDEGTEISIKVFTPTGIKVFDSIVLYSPLEENFVIEYAEISTEIQRREYTRVLFETKVVIQREDKSNVVTNTIDISGGGLKFFYEDNMISEEQVNITLFLPQGRSIQAKGAIICTKKLPDTEHVLYFTEIDEADRDRIVKLCFDIQTGRTLEVAETE